MTGALADTILCRTNECSRLASSQRIALVLVAALTECDEALSLVAVN